MEMASTTISDLCTFVRRRDLLPGVNSVIERLKFSRYGPSDLASYFQLPSDVDQAVRLLFSGILVLVHLPMVIDYFNGCVRAWCCD
jgi:hypothetical protein